MSNLREIGARVTDLTCHAIGRRNVVRAARFVLYRARLDVPNDIHTNGEAALQKWVFRFSEPGSRIQVIDVGANVGQWSSTLLAAAQRAGRLDDLDLHVFEPSSYSYERLLVTLNGQVAWVHRSALGDSSGHSTLHVFAPGAGSNSLHRTTESQEDVQTEEVATTTLDIYAGAAGLSRIALLKIDTEGNDFAVLRGARNLFAEHRISIVQFEYNHRWVYARFFLRDVFGLLGPLGYRIGKLTPRGVEFYPEWESDLETFVEGNYVACTEDFAQLIPSLAWWKAKGQGSS